MENTYLNPNSDTIESWAYLEIMGHDQLAGRLTTKKLGTSVMFQVDVPKGETEFSHSELFSPASIFSIKPTTEEWCRKWNSRRASYNRQVIPYIPASNQIPQTTNDDGDCLDGFDGFDGSLTDEED